MPRPRQVLRSNVLGSTFEGPQSSHFCVTFHKSRYIICFRKILFSDGHGGPFCNSGRTHFWRRADEKSSSWSTSSFSSSTPVSCDRVTTRVALLYRTQIQRGFPRSHAAGVYMYDGSESSRASAVRRRLLITRWMEVRRRGS